MAENDDLTDPNPGAVATDDTPAGPADAAANVQERPATPAAGANGQPAAGAAGAVAAEREGQLAGGTAGSPADLISRAYAHDDLTDLIARAAEANKALLNGDPARYEELLPHTDDYTLMPPFGGEPIRGHDDSPEARAASARFFQGGTATFDVMESYTSGDLAVLVVVERQTVRVGGLPEQNWSLRATLVFRREDGRWCLAHRHADVLLPGITIEHAAAIARGES